MGAWEDLEGLLQGGYLLSAVAVVGVVILAGVLLGIRHRRRRALRALDSYSTNSGSYGNRRSYVAELALPPLFERRGLVPVGQWRGARGLPAFDGSPVGGSGVRAIVGVEGDEHSDTASTGSFYSCQEEHDHAMQAALSWTSAPGSGRRLLREDSRRPLAPLRRKRPRRNANLVHQYGWLEPLLDRIVRGEAGAMGAVAHESSERCTPLFVLAGTCPSRLPPSPMQAALFCVRAGGLSDYWWVKPKGGGRELEPSTVSRHPTGPFKNAPGEKSRGAFDFLLRRFIRDAPCTQGAFTYGVDASERAFIEEVTPAGMRRRMVLYFIWVEHYSTLKKTLEGKLCFERPALGHHDGPGPHVPQLRARQFAVEGSELRLGPYEEEEVMPSMMPGEGFQEMY